MFGCERPAAFFASRRKRSMNESSAACRSSKTESISVSPVTAISDPRLLLRPLVQDCLQQHFRDRRGGRAAEAVLVLERHSDRDLRMVCGGEADEPGGIYA